LDEYLGARVVINIDKQCVATVRTLEALRIPRSAEGMGPGLHGAGTPDSRVRRHAWALMQRADAGCIEGSAEERELAAIADAIEA
jgi:hypothetical protein